MLISPGEAFTELARRPRVLVVLLLMLALQLGFVATWLSRADLAEMVRNQLLSQGREVPPAEQIPVGPVRNMTWGGAAVGLEALFSGRLAAPGARSTGIRWTPTLRRSRGSRCEGPGCWERARCSSAAWPGRARAGSR